MCAVVLMVRDHPRIRGEHLLDGRGKPRNEGSSPHTRGARPHRRRRPGLRRIIPAYAGSTCYHICIVGLDRDHPRIRGEHAREFERQPGFSGSSPHTRGAPAALGPAGRVPGIIPAYAGSTAISVWAVLTASDHPRIRGEHATKDPGARVAFGSSPHTRGAPDGRNTTSNHTRIIPAYAGSTVAAMAPPGISRDHPRIRGEHPGGPGRHPRPRGSSPHTRGAHRPH